MSICLVRTGYHEFTDNKKHPWWKVRYVKPAVEGDTQRKERERSRKKERCVCLCECLCECVMCDV